MIVCSQCGRVCDESLSVADGVFATNVSACLACVAEARRRGRRTGVVTTPRVAVMARYREDDAVCRRAGHVTHDEAQEILGRFNDSHFQNPGKERARYSIPADPRRDDDIRLGVYISRMERLDAAARAVVRRAREIWGNHLPSDFAALAAAIGADVGPP